MVVYDLSTLRFRRRDGRTLLLASSGEELACCGTDGLDDRRAAAAVLEEAAGTAVVWRDGVACQVGFYHPRTGEVSVGSWPRGRVLGAGRPLALDAAGTLGELRDGVLHLAGAELGEAELGSLEQLLRPLR